MQDFQSLDIWKRAHALALRIYRDTQTMPHEEVFGLRMMLRRCAIGIATAIVEGCGRESAVAFAGDLQRSVARCNELEYLVLLAYDLKLFAAETSGPLTQEVIEVRKMTYGLMRKL